MLIETLSTFPDMFTSVMGASMMKRAQEKGIIQFRAHNLRDWTHDKHRTTDDSPYGGGDGLVMKCEPIFEAYDDIVQGKVSVQVSSSSDSASTETPSKTLSSDDASHENAPALHSSSKSDSHNEAPDKPHTIFVAPWGTPFSDQCAQKLSHYAHLLFVCGHYEGIDRRAYSLADEVISLGDYVLTSGELASLVIIDAVVRKIPGVLGAQTGIDDESFVRGLLEYPQFTRPESIRGMSVPDVLLSGNHAAIKKWRHYQSLRQTALHRPDLLQYATLDEQDRKYLKDEGLQ